MKVNLTFSIGDGRKTVRRAKSTNQIQKNLRSTAKYRRIGDGVGQQMEWEVLFSSMGFWTRRNIWKFWGAWINEICQKMIRLSTRQRSEAFDWNCRRMVTVQHSTYVHTLPHPPQESWPQSHRASTRWGGRKIKNYENYVERRTRAKDSQSMSNPLM